MKQAYTWQQEKKNYSESKKRLFIPLGQRTYMDCWMKNALFWVSFLLGPYHRQMRPGRETGETHFCVAFCEIVRSQLYTPSKREVMRLSRGLKRSRKRPCFASQSETILDREQTVVFIASLRQWLLSNSVMHITRSPISAFQPGEVFSNDSFHYKTFRAPIFIHGISIPLWRKILVKGK